MSLLLITIVLLFIFIYDTYAEDKYNIDLRATFGSNSEIATTDYYVLNTDLAFEFNILDDFELTLGLEADRFEVEVEEITFKWKFSPYIYFLLGKFENALTLDEFVPAHKRLFGTKTLQQFSVTFFLQ